MSAEPPTSLRLPIEKSKSDLPGSSVQGDAQIICDLCKATAEGRNLIVCFDGTSNKFGLNNTNVVELYHRIIKDKNQLTYYNSGIGTYAKPRVWSLRKVTQVVSKKLDLAFAMNFEKLVLGGYRWLADHYITGDRIFLFGFSRGAYQARALAAMIAEVGLILPGNEEQIPFAWEIYADPRTRKTEHGEGIKSRNMLNRMRTKTGLGNIDESETFDMAFRFKETFSRPDVKVHFVGNWDAVSSIGLIRGKSLPRIDEYQHICYFRHALALDERRVKFLPEYINGGQEDMVSTTMRQQDSNAKPSVRDAEDVDWVVLDSSPTLVPRVKEVWFLGSHSDIGGGNVSNKELSNAAVPVIWMGNEALMAGVKLRPPKVEWDRMKLMTNKPMESLSFWWHFVEFLPVKHLAYTNREDTTRSLHRGRGRIIQPWQKIHASVAFAEDYKPKAVFSPQMADRNWSDIVGKASKGGKDWVSGLEQLIEKDLFDRSLAAGIIKKLSNGPFKLDLSGRLKLIALSGDEGARAILMADPELQTLFRMLRSNKRAFKVDSARILIALWQYSEKVEYLLDARHASILRDEIIHMIENGTYDEKKSAWGLLQSLLGSNPFYPLLVSRERRIEHRSALLRDKIVPLVERTFNHRSDEGSRRRAQAAAIVLRGIAGHERIRDEIVNSKIIKHLYGMLLGSERDIAVSALRDLSQYESIRHAISNMGLVDHLARMFKSNNEGSRRAATLLLAELFQHEELRPMILKNAIVSNLATNLQDEDHISRNMAAWLLEEMSRHDEFRDSALQEKVKKISDDLTDITDLHMQISATGTLLNFLPYAEFRDKISVKEVIRILLNMIQPTNPTLLCEALAMLAQLITYGTHGDSELQIQMPNDDLAKKLLHALKYAKFVHPRRSIMHFLKHCSGYDKLWRSLHPDGSRSRLLRIASKLERRDLKNAAAKLREIDENRNTVNPTAISLTAESQKYNCWTSRGSGPLNILCLDGGGVFGLSSLYILKVLLQQLAAGSGAKTLPLPCEAFDMICGTSTGGVIALMLGRLRMDIDDAISSYKEFSKSVFQEQTMPGPAKYDGSRLRGRIRRMVSKYSGGEESLLQDPFDGSRRCSRTFVVATVQNVATPKLFRTYAAHGKPADACNIWDAAQATNTMYPFFGPALIGSPRTNYLDGSFSGWNNPSPLAIEEIREVFPSRKIGCFVSLGTGIPHKRPSKRPQTVGDAYIQLAKRCEEVHEATLKQFQQKSGMRGEEYFRFSVDSVTPIELRREWEMRKGLGDITSEYMRHPTVEARVTACVEALGGKNMGTPTTEVLPEYSLNDQL